MVVFDLGPPLIFNDDFQYAWSVRRLVGGHGFQMLPLTNALALVQTLWGALFSLGHPDQRVLRLSVVPFILLAAASAWSLARRLGADRFWSAVAAAGMIASPIFLANSTTFMSDTPYIGLLMAAALAGVAGLQNGSARAGFVVLCFLCPLQRQVGLAIPAALTAAVLLAHRRGSRPPGGWGWVAAAWAAAALAALLPVVTGIAPGLGLAPPRPGAVWTVLPLVMLPGMVGLLLLPFAGGFLASDGPGRPGPLEHRGALLVMAGGSGLALAAALHFNVVVFPGNIWTRAGIAPELAGKAPLFPDALFVAVEAAALLTFATLLLRLLARPSAIPAGPRETFLVALALAQFLPLLALRNYPWDRYYLAVAAPLLPLAAAVAARSPWQAIARRLAVASLALGVGLYVLAEQDYQAWQAARDQAARLAYRLAAPTDVQAGYGANVAYAELPLYERTGDPGWLLNGAPLHPAVRLLFAPWGDPRPGVDYRSFRSGRIVIERP